MFFVIIQLKTKQKFHISRMNVLNSEEWGLIMGGKTVSIHMGGKTVLLLWVVKLCH